jgi:hypothetical protein
MLHRAGRPGLDQKSSHPRILASTRNPSQLPSIQKPIRKINMPRPQKLRHILAQEIISARATDSPIEMIMQQEMHSMQLRQLEAIDLLAIILVRQQQLHRVRGQNRAQPVPLVGVSRPKPNISVGALVAAASVDDPA